MPPKRAPFLKNYWPDLRKFLSSIAFATLTALALRLTLVIALRALPIGLDDMFQYDMLARSLAAGNGFRWYAAPDLALIQSYFTAFNFQLPADYDPRGLLTSFRAPLYPAFLALIYRLGGLGAGRFFIVRLTQVFLSAALVPLTAYLARRIFPAAPRVALGAAWAVSLAPLLILYPLALATENLFFILFLASLIFLTLAAQTRQTRFFLLSGLFLGLTALTRSVILAFGGLILLWGFFSLREPRKTLLLALTLALTIFPWVARNSLLHGKLTGIETSLGYNLYLGYHPLGSGTFQYGISLDLLPILDDAAREQIGIAAGLKFIAADPARAAFTLPLLRAGHFFGLERRALQYFYSNNFFGEIPLPRLEIAALLALTPFIILACSAAFGLALWRWKSENLVLPLALFGYSLPHIFLLAEERFHYALIPTLAIFAALCWDGGWQALRQRWQFSRAGKIALALALLALLLLFFNWGHELARDRFQLWRLLAPGGSQSYFPY